MIVEVMESLCALSTWPVHVIICKVMFCRKCLMRVPQMAWWWDGLWGAGVGMGTVAYVCVDGRVVCASSVGGGGAGLVVEAFMMT